MIKESNIRQMFEEWRVAGQAKEFSQTQAQKFLRTEQ